MSNLWISPISYIGYNGYFFIINLSSFSTSYNFRVVCLYYTIMIPSWKIKIVLSALWQGKQNLPIAGRKHTGHGKSIKKEAEMQVFSRLHGVLNALGWSISRPDISQSNCCHVSWRTSWLERGQRNPLFTYMRLYRSTKPSFSHRSAFTLSQRFTQNR